VTVKIGRHASRNADAVLPGHALTGASMMAGSMQTASNLDADKKRLDQEINVKTDGRCACPDCKIIKGVTEAEITFNKFHVMQLIGCPVDEVRRAETKSRPELKRSRYLWLKNARNRKVGQRHSACSARNSNINVKFFW